MFFYGMTTNLNWEILTKNLVTFKRWDVGRIWRGNCLKREAWRVCRFKGSGRGGGKKEGGVDTPMHTYAFANFSFLYLVPCSWEKFAQNNVVDSANIVPVEWHVWTVFDEFCLQKVVGRLQF